MREKRNQGCFGAWQLDILMMRLFNVNTHISTHTVPGESGVGGMRILDRRQSKTSLSGVNTNTITITHTNKHTSPLEKTHPVLLHLVVSLSPCHTKKENRMWLKERMLLLSSL